jgi:hypothetical protein
MNGSAPFVLTTLAAGLAAQAPTHISPAEAALRLGRSNNSIPFSWTPTAYQQVHDAASFSNMQPTVVTSLSFRMASPNSTGHTIDVEIWMAQSPNDAASASQVFASNVSPGTEMNIFTRKMFNLPTVPNNAWVISYPFDNPFVFTGTNHVSWRAIVWGNSNNNQFFVYPLDAFNDGGSSTGNGAAQGCQAQNGAFPATHFTYIGGPGGTARFEGYSNVSTGGLPALLVIGGSATNWLGLPLPYDLAPHGAPGCLISNSLTMVLSGVTNANRSGDVSITAPIPNDPSLGGAILYSQYWFVHPSANALGLFTSNSMTNTIGTPPGIARIYATGNPNATTGTAERRYGMSIGLN